MKVNDIVKVRLNKGGISKESYVVELFCGDYVQICARFLYPRKNASVCVHRKYIIEFLPKIKVIRR